VTIKGTDLAGATKVTFNGTVATILFDKAGKIDAYVPAGATTGYIKVKTPSGTARSDSEFTVLTPLDSAMSLVGGGYSYCAALTSGGVNCWGYGAYGELGNGAFSNSATPVAVEDVEGSGSLTGVMSVVSDAYDGDCALLT
jgi:hypothetical protein